MKKFMLFLALAAFLTTACSEAKREKAVLSDMPASEAVEKSKKADSVAFEQQSGYSAEESPASNNTESKDRTDKRRFEPENRYQAWDSAFVRKNSNRKLIKTAKLGFCVADVEKTTVDVEHLAARYGGFILSSEIRCNVNQYVTQRINKDTVLEVGLKSIVNDITLRVPEFLLDTVLYEISTFWTKLDERTINAEDVTISLLANELRARMYQKTASGINKAAQNNQKELDDVVNAEQTAAQYLENTIQKRIENLTLQDKIDYATITLHLYQDNVLYKKKSASYRLEDYGPGFGSEFTESLEFGWKILLGFILFLAKGWSVLLIMLGLFLLIYLPIRMAVKRKKGRKE